MEKQYDLNKMTKHEKKELRKMFQMTYETKFRKHFPCLPEKLDDLSETHLLSVGGIDAILGSAHLTNLLQLRTANLRLHKYL